MVFVPTAIANTKIANDLGGDLSTGLADRLADMPTWIWFFIVIALVILMQPWKNIQGVPKWVWMAVGILAVWTLITGK